MGDLWFFDINGEFWTYIGGSLSVDCMPTYPGDLLGSGGWGCRQGHSMHFDAANNELLLFGGLDHQAGYYNDIWIYDVLAVTWYWVAGAQGSTSVEQWSSELGVFDAASKPKGRAFAATTFDQDNLMMFVYGGEVTDGKS